MRRIRELDGLRAIAIFLVLGCHYEGFSQLAWRIPELGWIGVDLFFCLSGYLITSILLGLRGRTTPYKTFYSRRLMRILPPYVAVTALVCVYAAHNHSLSAGWLSEQLFFLQAFRPQQNRAVWDVLTHFRWYLHHLAPLLSGANHLLPEQVGAPLSVLLVPFIFWSLSIEEYFYLLWAPIVLRLSRTGILSVGVVICLIEMMLRWLTNLPEVYFGVAYRFDALLYGAFLAILLEHWRRTSTPRWSRTFFTAILVTATACVAGILLEVGPVLGRDPRSSPLVLLLGLPLLSIAFAALIGLLVLRSDSNWWLSRLLRTRVFQFVGTISYTMYLVHLIAAAWIRNLSRVNDVFHQTFLQAVLATGLTIVMAQVSWIFLEKKVLAWKDKRFPNIPHPPEPNVPGLGQSFPVFPQVPST